MCSCNLRNDYCKANVTFNRTAETVTWERVILIRFRNVREEKGGGGGGVLKENGSRMNINVLLLLYDDILHFCLSRGQEE